MPLRKNIISIILVDVFAASFEFGFFFLFFVEEVLDSLKHVLTFRQFFFFSVNLVRFGHHKIGWFALVSDEFTLGLAVALVDLIAIISWRASFGQLDVEGLVIRIAAGKL